MSTTSPQEYIAENEGVIGVIADTLGSHGKHEGNIISTTRIKILCQNCFESEWEANVGNHMVRSTDVPYCTSCKNRLGIIGMKGQSHSEETIEKMGLPGDRNPAKRDDVRQKISNALTGRDAHWLKGKSRPAHSRKMSEFMQRVWNERGFRDEYKSLLIRGVNRTHSKLHDRVKAWMKREGFTGFESEQVVDESDHGIIVDELHREKDLIVEIYGDYWHANPRVYSDSDLIKYPGVGNLEAKTVRNRDLCRNSFVRDAGYSVVIVWESEFQNNKSRVRQKISEKYD